VASRNQKKTQKTLLFFAPFFSGSRLENSEPGTVNMLAGAD